MTQQKPPFTFYRNGYVDGYYGMDPEFPSNDFYMTGHAEGREADRSGEPSKFGEEKPRTRSDVSPVTPAQCILQIEFTMMRVGDIVWIDHGTSKKLGIIVSPKKTKKWVGPVFEVLVDDKLMYAPEHKINLITPGEKT